MGKNTFTLIENGNQVAKTSFDIFDFAPIVVLNDEDDGENIIYSNEECPNIKKETISLSSAFDKDLREYTISEIVVVKNSTSKIPLKIIQGYDPLGPQDNDGIVEFSCSNSNVKITPESKKVSYADEIEIEIDHTLGRGEKFVIDIKGKDDSDDMFGASDLEVISGKLKCSVIEKDVFLSDEYKKMKDEIDYFSPFAKAHSLSEYRGNYCMQAAERALSKLFDNQTNFYSVDKSHKRLNKVSYFVKGKKLGAGDRGTYFKSLGYTKSDFTFDDFDIDHDDRKAIIDKSSYKANAYSVVKLKKGSKLFTYLSTSIKDKIGYHIYYFYVTGGFHTLILVIDNTNPCDQKYNIYDQYGETSSKGKFVDIEEGIAKQVSWTFANSCLSRYESHLNHNNNKHKQWDSTETKLWKMQRK